MRCSKRCSRSLRGEPIRRIVWLETAFSKAVREFRRPPARTVRLRAGGRVCLVFESGCAVAGLRPAGLADRAGGARVGRGPLGEEPDADLGRSLPIYPQSALSGNAAGGGGTDDGLAQRGPGRAVRGGVPVHLSARDSA